MKIKLLYAPLSRFVRQVAGLATHIERHVPASLLRNIQSRRVATQAEIFFLVARSRLQQLELVFGFVWIMTF
jgi:hypothetical protein